MKENRTTGDLVASIHKKLCAAFPKISAETLGVFLHRFLNDDTPESLQENLTLGLVDHLVKFWGLIHTWDGLAPKIDIYPYRVQSGGNEYKRTIIHILHKDSPFLVDSLLALFARLGRTCQYFMECDLHTTRDGAGSLLGFPATAAGKAEAYLRFELRGESSLEECNVLQAELKRTLEDVRSVVSDWLPMRQKVEQSIQELGYLEPFDDIPEVSEFLAWINDHHFTFLGYREFPLKTPSDFTGDHCLGIFKNDRCLPLIDLQKLNSHHTAFVASKDLIRFNQTKEPATVHRALPMDVIALKMFDKSGKIIGVRQFIGLSASISYNRSPRDIPILRLKVRRLLERSGYNPHGYMGKMLIQALEHFPRDELFQSTEDELFHIMMSVLRLGTYKKVALFTRQDPYGEFVSCLVYVAKDRYSASLKESFGALLSSAFAGQIQSASSHVTDFPFARLHFILATELSTDSIDVCPLIDALEAASRPWSEQLRSALMDQLGEEAGHPLALKYEDSFPSSYQELFEGKTALEDIRSIEAALVQGLQTRVYANPESPEDLRVKVYNLTGPVPLASILPILNNLDFNVSKDMSYKVTPKGTDGVWIQDLEPLTSHSDLTPEQVQERFSEAFGLVWGGFIENDGFNRLLLRTDLDVWQIQILRAYCKYLKQIGFNLSQIFIEETLVTYGSIAQKLVHFFEYRFDPQQKRSSAEEERLRKELEAAFDAVVTLDQDRIIRKFYNLICSTWRTNAYQRGSEGVRKDYLSFKFDSKLIDELPAPRPYCEIFVYSPRMEAIHLRGGRVARGGIRWSDRREDFRTEVLSLVKAQMIKNAVIVPVGSKGGFVVKELPLEREAQKAEIIACYQMMISGLLDLTDNIVQGKTVPPIDVVSYDEPDPYLVVAADKGTATFSDIANELSARYGFWLADAFASGGSVGYDHKKMGITARGAWESTRRHFRELGIQPDTDPFTTIAIGDMAGDIFGNGMLLSPCIQLVAAFNHQYIFVDPTPDIKTSFAERNRLFQLPTSTWKDYNQDLISPGGGVFNRSEKSIELTPQMREALEISPEIQHLAPSELIQHILKAPVDLMWFGGIGTFVKATRETHLDASDRSNDLLRVDAVDMRCKVIVEGANLGMTQNARIEFALNGGLINTDAIDNSGGVDCSDHEVNIKVLLSQVMQETQLSLSERNALLASMTDAVAHLVLRDNYLQNLLLSLKQQAAVSQVEDHALLMKRLEDEGVLDRVQNDLPGEGALAERMANQQGLTRPELSVLIAHTKTWLYDSLIASDFLDDPALEAELFAYFPEALRKTYASQILNHPLRREIIGTVVANELVNRFGMTIFPRLNLSTGQSIVSIAKALYVMIDLFGLKDLWGSLEALDHTLPAHVFLDLFSQIQNAMEKITLGFLQSKETGHVGQVREDFAGPLQELFQGLGKAIGGQDLGLFEDKIRALTHLHVPQKIARRIIFLKTLSDNALDIIRTATLTAHSVIDTAKVYFYLSDTLGLSWARDVLNQIHPTSSWQTLSRSLLYGDLLRHQTQLVKAILQSHSHGQESPLERWQDAHQYTLERIFNLIKELQVAPDLGLPHVDILARSLVELETTL
jgi:glutamate dehydrogenase